MKPPADPAVDNMLWSEWERVQREVAFPGWSPCRFPHRTQPDNTPEMARFVFGITNGPWGIWEQAYDVCRRNEDGSAQIKESERLFTLTHLPTGHGFGLFEQRGYAALAADTATRACPEWADELIAPGTMDRTRECLRAVGLRCDMEQSHAHDQSTGQGPFMIWTLTALEEGKPEKLS